MQDGGPAGLQGQELSLSSDLSVRDAALRASEQRFRTAMASMVDPVVVLTAISGVDSSEILDFVVSFTNGRPGTPRVGTLLSGLWPVRTKVLMVNKYREVLDDGRDLVLDGIQLPRESGPSRYFDIRASRLDRSEVLATWRDVTDRVEAAAALAHSEALLRGAFDEAPVAGVLLGLGGPDGDPGHPGVSRGKVLKVNRAFTELTGYRQGELLGMPFHRLVHPDDLLEGVGGQFPWELPETAAEPLRLRTADGAPVWVKLTTSEVSQGDQPAYLVVHVEDLTNTLQIEHELAQRSLHDPLTGLANRHLLLERFRLAVDNLDRHPGALVVLHIDLDRFKDINDTYGHNVGDDVLAEVGRRLNSMVDSPDMAARLTGDEFVIVTSARAARRGAAGVTGVATRLAEQVSEAIGEVIRLPEHEDLKVQLSVSIGIAVTTSAESEPEQLLLQADRAMFEAKRRGRRRHEVFRQSLSTTAHERLRVEQEARDAVENGWLRLQYQPVIDLTTGRLGGAEALLRIAHPERGLLRPGSFIDILEDSELILPIGDWVLTEACRQLAKWQEMVGLGEFSMAVNVSGRQASDSGLTGHVMDAAAAARIDPSRLCLEMTERVLIDADDSVVADLRRLTAKGVQVALDDFGTGYASLSYLQRFPVSTLKIDRSFVEGLGITATDTAIVSSIVALADALDLDVVAEGVETAAQLGQLTRPPLCESARASTSPHH